MDSISILTVEIQKISSHLYHNFLGCCVMQPIFVLSVLHAKILNELNLHMNVNVNALREKYKIHTSAALLSIEKKNHFEYG